MCGSIIKELGLVGGVLRAEGKVVGFSIENVHQMKIHLSFIFEKAADIQGAYPMINQQFVIHEMEDFKYVNREDDAGEEGLRKVKIIVSTSLYGRQGRSSSKIRSKELTLGA